MIGPLVLLTVFAAQEPSTLQVHVIEGEGVIYPIGSRATRGIAVQVTDETSRPVEGVIVSFRLPEEGPGGTFATGSKTEIVNTGSDGRASVWGMRWNGNVGSFEVRITAAKGQTRAGTVCTQVLTDMPVVREAALARVRVGRAHGHKWLWITVAAGGVAFGSAAAIGLASKSGTTPPAAPSGVQIGTPSIILGRP